MLDTIEVDNPHRIRVPDLKRVRGELRYDPQTVLATRTTRDQLSRMHKHRHISDVQYRAGREFQRNSEAASRQQRSSGDIQERVDGGRVASDGITDRMQRAARQDGDWQILLGATGYKLVYGVAINGWSVEFAARECYGVASSSNRKYASRRLRECLDTLAESMGLG